MLLRPNTITIILIKAAIISAKGNEIQTPIKPNAFPKISNKGIANKSCLNSAKNKAVLILPKD